MGAVRWKGKALPVAQVSTVTVGGTWVAGDTVTVTINGKALVLTVGTTVTTAQVATELKQLWNGDASPGAGYAYSETGNNVPEFAEATATVSGSVVTLTGQTKGKPFTLAVAKTSAAGTVALATPTAATGPNYWPEPKNWDTGAVPVAADDVFLDDSGVSILYGLDQSAVLGLASLTIAASYTGTIGLPETNADGTAYLEYRDQYLKLGASAGTTAVTIGLGPGQGSGRLKIDFTTGRMATVVHASGTPAETGLEAVLLKGTHASNVLTCRGTASVGVAVFGGEAATLNPLTVEESASVRCGAGVTLSGTLLVNGGVLEVNSAVPTLTLYGGEVTVNGSGGATQLNVWAGVLHWNSTGTVGGAAVVGQAGQLDFSQDPRTKTVTNPIDVYSADGVSDPKKVVSTLVVDYNGVAPLAALGANVRLSRGTPA